LCVLRLVFPLNSSLHPGHTHFLLATSHWNCSFNGSGTIFLAVFLSAGSRQSPLHT
jgi:hypothetical protein